jgi:hypothetical protein
MVKILSSPLAGEEEGEGELNLITPVPACRQAASPSPVKGEGVYLENFKYFWLGIYLNPPISDVKVPMTNQIQSSNVKNVSAFEI